MLWGGRFSEPTDDNLRALNDSFAFDYRLFKHDIQGSIAYARGLIGAGVLTQAESATIINGLNQVLGEFEAGLFIAKAGDEDIHTAVERRLIELVGEVGGKLHTGRSRNDQVATDFRLWMLDEIAKVDALIAQLQLALIDRAEANLETLMPGYTHLQPAQPITAAHWLMSFFWMLARDRERLADARQRMRVSPLGAGALAGTPLTLNRTALARVLGFTTVSQNSLDAVSDRDYVAEALFALALLGIHLSRLAEDIILYNNPAFGFITLADRHSTGSSLMPQKRNPDPLELARGKTGRLIGQLTGFMATLKGLPSAYNKDLQEDKQAAFDSFDTLTLILPVVTAVIRTLHLNPDKMQAALVEEMLATDLADYLVRKGLPFRQAHHISGAAVRQASEQGIRLSALSLEALQALSPLFEADVRDVFDFKASVAARHNVGGTAPQAVRQQIDEARQRLALSE